MFSQSVTAKILKNVGNKFSQSVLYGLFLSFVEFIAEIYNKSFLKRYIDSKPFFNSAWADSFLARFFDKIFAFITRVIISSGRLLKTISNGSITAGVFEKLSCKIRYHQTLSLIFGVMFLIYSSLWNNMYAAGAAVILVIFLIYKDKGRTLQPSKVDFFMVLFLLSMILGVFAAHNKADALRIFMIAASALLFHLCTFSALDTNKKVTDFTKIISFAIFITAVVAIGQRIMGIEVDPEFVDLENNAGMPGRVFSTMENPNNYAEILVLFMPFMFALFINEKNIVMKVFRGVMAAVTFVALVMTYSRSCYVAAAIAIVVFILIYDYRLILPALIIAMCAIPLLPSSVFNRILTIGSLSDSSNSYRLYIWDVCIRLVENYGISGLGIGPEAFRSFYRPISHKTAIQAPHSHMLYLELILEYGIVGFIGFMGYYIRLIRNGFKAVKLADKKEKSYIGAGIGALLGISFVCMAEYIWFYPRDMFAHFIVMGMLAAVIRNISKERSGGVK